MSKDLITQCYAFVLEQSGGEWDDKTILSDAKKMADFVRAQADEWQPIETAPKNGGPINIYVPIHQPDRRVLSAYWTDAGWWICSGSIVAGKPTHWQPLPHPPHGAA